jgi:hypothetical protein
MPPEEPKSLTSLVSALPRKIFTREAVLWLLTLLLGGVATAQGIERLDGGLDKRVAPLAEKFKSHEAEEAAKIEALNKKFDNSEERNARRFEVLYNAVLERQPQPGADELMKAPPLTDGGR